MTETIQFWDFDFISNITTHLPCSQCWSFKPDTNSSFGLSEKTKRECLDHQKICLATKTSPSNKQISREEWEDNMQRSRIPKKDSVDKKRDDIFKQIFG